MEDSEINQLKNKYYSNIPVLYEMIKHMQGREVTFMSKNKVIRCIKAHAFSYLIKNMDAFSFKTEPYNIYGSLAKLYGMPMFSFDLPKRKEQQREFNLKFDDFIVGYDLAFDFDAHECQIQKAYHDCNTLKESFDKYGVPYYLKFSGSGFHMEISSRFLPRNMLPNFDGYARIVNRVKEIYNLDTMDMFLSDKRRIWKIPYSFDVKTGNIALPLNDKQFSEFNLEMVKPDNVLKYGVRGRGLLERKGTQLDFSEFLADLMDVD